MLDFGSDLETAPSVAEEFFDSRTSAGSFGNMFDCYDFPSTSPELNFKYTDMPMILFSDRNDEFDLDCGSFWPDTEVRQEQKENKIIQNKQKSKTNRTIVKLRLSGNTRIGPLTRDQRAERVQRYLEKRQRRVWSKRVSYLCRKRVAEQRIRYKGRFVSKSELPTQ